MDRIFSSRPVNKAAALVTGKGVHYTAPEKCYGGTVWQDTPIKTEPLHKSVWDANANLTGRQICRLRVIGYKGSGKKSAKWVVRCVCGHYGIQTGAYLRTPTAQVRAMCPACDHLEYLRGTQRPG
jgi:hypothetical protein